MNDITMFNNQLVYEDAKGVVTGCESFILKKCFAR